MMSPSMTRNMPFKQFKLKDRIRDRLLHLYTTVLTKRG